jgi:hypothetical protein
VRADDRAKDIRAVLHQYGNGDNEVLIAEALPPFRDEVHRPVDYESTNWNDEKPDANVGLIANTLLGSIMRIADQHPSEPSAHKVTQEQNGWTGTPWGLVNQSASY